MGRYLGLISGTSVDGIDAVIADFDGDARPGLAAARTFPYPDGLRRRIELVAAGRSITLAELVRLDAEIGNSFGAAARDLLAETADGGSVRAIGSHGQTVAHHPGGESGGSLQLGDPNRIAAMTGLPVAADFRRADIAAGGEGAPLASLFHAAVFPGNSAVLNLGGIANLTILGPDGGVRGFDTGPGNTLLDGWARHCGIGPCDEGGAFARTGVTDERLLASLLHDAYFTKPPPKSTGRERFNLGWLERRLEPDRTRPADVQATLAELTAVSVADAVRLHAGGVERMYVCGGGVHNAELMQRLAERLAPLSVESSAVREIDPDYVEAMTFAWLARERMHARSPKHLTAVTGAKSPAILGAIWLPPLK